MAIPDFQTLMLPVLESAKDGERKIAEVVDQLADDFDLSAEEREELLPSGKQSRFANRVHWARSYLKQAGLLKSVRRGIFQITEAGRSVLDEEPRKIDKQYLERFSEYLEFKAREGNRTANKEMQTTTSAADEATPDEILNSAYEEINATLRLDILSRLRESDPAFFEDIIVRLLLKMGYGYDTKSGQVIGKSGDDGVDGVINLDRLGVDQVYVQAKRYASTNVIGSGAIRDFYGALGMKDVTKGIFVTTSSFSSDATRTIEKLGARIVPIDGIQLAQLMIDHEIGCRIKRTYPISEVDESFFE